LCEYRYKHKEQIVIFSTSFVIFAPCVNFYLRSRIEPTFICAATGVMTVRQELVREAGGGCNATLMSAWLNARKPHPYPGFDTPEVQAAGFEAISAIVSQGVTLNRDQIHPWSALRLSVLSYLEKAAAKPKKRKRDLSRSAQRDLLVQQNLPLTLQLQPAGVRRKLLVQQGLSIPLKLQPNAVKRELLVQQGRPIPPWLQTMNKIDPLERIRSATLWPEERDIRFQTKVVKRYGFAASKPAHVAYLFWKLAR
jgi:hypothetical protein